MSDKPVQSEPRPVKTGHWSEAALRVLRERYLTREDGQVVETPEEMCWRVAGAIAAAEARFGRSAAAQREIASAFYEMMVDGYFLPNSPTLMNAGKGNALQYSACYVLPVGDSMAEIFESIKAAAIIQQSGGGTGFAFSRLRPKNDIVHSTGGRASGPVSFLRVFNAATEAVKQGGCVTPDTRVSTDRGLIQIGTLGPLWAAPDSWHPHRQALRVATDHGAQASDEFYLHGSAHIRRVRTEHGYALAGTLEHRVRVIDDRGDYVWREIGDLKIGDWVALQKNSYLPVDSFRLPDFDHVPHYNATPIRIPTHATPDLGEFIGFFLGDGAVTVNARGIGRLILTVCVEQPDVREHVVKLAADLFGLRPSSQRKPGDGSENLFFASTTLVKWLRAMGIAKRSAADVDLPELAFQAGPQFACGLLRGLFTADGAISSEGYPSLASISEPLLLSVQRLLLSVGVPSAIGVDMKRAGAFGRRPLYRLRVITRAGLKAFADRIGFFAAAKRARLAVGLAKRWEFNDVIPFQGEALRELYGGPGRGSGPGRGPRGANHRLYRALQHHLPRVAAPRHLTRSRLEALAAVHPEIGRHPRFRWFLDNDQFYDQISKIEEGEALTVDLSVPESNTYIANGFVSHNTRRGANMGVLRIDHPDILEFIESKLEGGITNFNISVGATDAFMEALEAGGEYELVNPRDGQVTGRLSAREVFQRIVRAAWRTGDPGMVFLDRINRSPANPVPAFGAIEATNPCVTGETLIHTSRGLVRVDALAQAGESVGVALDSRFGVGDRGGASAPFVSGTRPVFRLTTREGYALRLTSDHRVMTAAGWRRADELQPGDRLHLLNQKGAFGTEGSLEEGRVLGWLVGDGYFTAEGRAVLSFYGEEKRELAPRFAAYVNAMLGSEPGARYHVGGVDIPSRDQMPIASTRLARMVSDRHGLDAQSKLGAVRPSVLAASEALQRGFLQALFTADGHASGSTEKGVSVRLTSISLPLLRDVQRMLLNFGIASRLYADRHGRREVSMPDGKGGNRAYPCQPDHDLVVARDNVARFAREIGFLTSAKIAALATLTSAYTRGPYRESFTARFEALVPDGVETVYDLKEPFTNSFVANGLVVHNCGEQPLAPNDACNLGSLNLARFVRETPGGGTAVDWDELERVTRLAVRFLDDVIEVNPYPLPEIAATVKANRRIGLGVMGWADLLFLLGIPYDSEEALALGEQLMGFIQAKAHDQSTRLAEERGPFPAFPHSIYRDGRPLRNSTVTTIAPTGTISMIAGCSSGIEPAYALAFEHRVHGPDGERVLPFISETFERLARARGFHSDALMAEVVRRGSVQGIPGLDESVRAVFKTAHEIDYRWHVQHQAAFQRHTDNGVSKTINFPNDATEDDVAQAYLLAWQRGCLGITVFRDGSKGGQVLHVGVGRGDDAAVGPAERVVKPRPHSLAGSTYRMETPIGTAFITVNDTAGGDPFEVFVQVGKGGSDTMAVAEALGRLISLILRLPSPLSARRRVEEVVSQLSRIGGGQPTGFGAARILSLPDALARTLGEHLGQRAAPAAAGAPVVRQIGDLCRECGQATFIYEEGCKKCVSCGFNEC